ncbi:E3 binding domain-containing protein, partial [Tamlana crocina]
EEAVAQAEGRVEEAKAISSADYSDSNRFYSPLVKNIAKEEGISFEELEQLEGTGKEGRVTKNDILGYLENRSAQPQKQTQSQQQEQPSAPKQSAPQPAKTPVSVNGEDEIIEMSRMGKM